MGPIMFRQIMDTVGISSPKNQVFEFKIHSFYTSCCYSPLSQLIRKRQYFSVLKQDKLNKDDFVSCLKALDLIKTIPTTGAFVFSSSLVPFNMYSYSPTQFALNTYGWVLPPPPLLWDILEFYSNSVYWNSCC